LKKEDNVLDVGCGNGRFYQSFASNDVVYTGIDNSNSLIEIAKRTYPEANFVLGSALNMPFLNEAFDAVYSIAVLHHMPSPDLRKEFISEIRRVAKKKAYIILTVWDLKEKVKKESNKKGMAEVFNLFLQRFDKKDFFIPWYGAKNCYFHSFTMEDFRKLVEESGLKIIESGEILVGKKPYRNFYIVSKNI
jgi:tRNA (uracil-5-)-methyltransferase TRM9